MAGYSTTPLIHKLGYQPGDTVFCRQAPDWFTAQLASNGMVVVQALPATWCHTFFTQQSDIATFLQKYGDPLLPGLAKGWWVSWPKKSAGVPTDITEQTFRDILLPLGWVDTKVCAVDETWSGLKFLRRKAAAV